MLFSKYIVALKRAVCCCRRPRFLLGAGVFGDGLCAFTDCVLCQLTGQEKTNCGLDLPTGDGGPFVVVGQTRSLGGNALEDVVDKAVHDAHGLARDASVGMYLLEHLVDVDGITLLPLSLLLLVSLGDVLLGLARFLRSLSASLGWHDESECQPAILHFFYLGKGCGQLANAGEPAVL